MLSDFGCSDPVDFSYFQFASDSAKGNRWKRDALYSAIFSGKPFSSFPQLTASQ